ncbi:cystathionine gamma-synthase [Nitzschia inconspicua]|uniref:Cystathionine gamma-synthase n=1 Tax=Nitzschia inconspicua TaxID=303405 RepID=A0A9K3PYK4_9STRA|nr:cystathionine gamma-synthase [Nitzschia inconspicua]
MLARNLVSTLCRRQAKSCKFCVSTSVVPPHVHPPSLSNRRFSTATRDDDDNLHTAADLKVSWKESLHLELPHSSKPLGTPLPFDEHACSVSLPTWCSVVGYEEGDQEVVSAMNCGYPRFVYHPYILQLMQVFLDKYSSSDSEGRPTEDCLVLPTKEAALRCQSFLQESLEGNNNRFGRRSHTVSVISSFPTDNALIERLEGISTTPSFESRIRVESLEEADVYAVLFPAETAAGTEAKAYWQHTGELVSSRRAENALKILKQKVSKRVTCCPVGGTPSILHSSDTFQSQPVSGESSSSNLKQSAYEKLQERIARWTQVDSDNIFLLPSGMATIYKSLRSARRYQLEKNPSSRGGTSIVYGFPYLDTLKMCSRREFSPAGVEFFGRGDVTDLELLERLLRLRSTNSRWSALFTEVPSNPLLQCPDLVKLRKLADEFDFCLVVDDTIGNFLNVDLIDSGLADAVCTSLTKLVSGRGDAIAGSVVLNPNTEKGRWMKEDMAKDSDLYGGLHESDAMAMVHNCRDFPERNARINETSELLADFLQEHQGVETVWYPKFVAPLFRNYQKPNGGFGGLMSIHLHPHICQRTFYDTLDVAKGPSLGTNFTLVCPYTLLAHYHELDFAMSYNVPPNLIRIAVGLEDFDELKEKFSYALNKSRLHPKLPS